MGGEPRQPSGAANHAPATEDLAALGDASTHADPARLEALFACESLESVLESGLTAQVVLPGAQLAAFAGASLCNPGPYVRSVDGGLEANVLGYLSIRDGVVAVIPPIWISPDRAEAHFVYLPLDTPCPQPPVGWLRELLEQLEVCHGVLDSAIDRIGCQPFTGDVPAATLVARGTPAQQGCDARVELAFDPEKMAGRIQPDGSIDFRERNSAVGVTSGQVLGTLHPATPGSPGTDIAGEEIPAGDGADRVLLASENVRLEQLESGERRYWAEVDGAVSIRADMLRVDPVFRVQGDVDYDTGNIDVTGDVHVAGSVRSTFTISAGGSVLVSGVVEPGAIVRARGDVMVAKGIVGERTRVLALGDVTTRFVQNSSVMARGDIVVGTSIINAEVRAGGSIQVMRRGGARSGSIVGGQAAAGRRIVAHDVGSRAQTSTAVGIEPGPESAAQLARLRQAIEHCESSIMRLARTLGMARPNAAQLRALMRHATPERRQFIAQSVQKLHALSRAREESLQRQAAVEKALARGLARGEIVASGVLHPGVRVRIADAYRTVATPLQDRVFRYHRGNIVEYTEGRDQPKPKVSQ
jgi:uncharacterized protein